MLPEQLIIAGLFLVVVSTFIMLVRNRSGNKQEATIYQPKGVSTQSSGAQRFLIAMVGFGVTYAIQLGGLLALKNILQIRVKPTETQWFILPFIAAITFWYFSPRVELRAAITGMTLMQRLIAAIYISWMLVFSGYSILIKPRMWTYGYYGEVAAWLLLPPTVITAVALIFRWAFRRRPSN